MTTTIKLSYYGMDGEGATVKDAKLDAGAKIEKALNGSYAPDILVLEGHAAIVIREPSGWGYRLITDEAGQLRPGKVYVNGYETESEANRQARRHLAQCAWNRSNDDACLDFIHDQADKREFIGWTKWQRAYLDAVANGKSSEEARELACVAR